MSGLLNNRKFLVGMGIFNTILILFLGFYIVNRFFIPGRIGLTESVQNNQVEVSELSDTYTLLIEDNLFDAGNGIIFDFGSDGEFSGFFDADNMNVEGYSYQLVKREGVDFLDIFNEDRSRSVSYEFSMLDDGSGITLYHRESDTTFTLYY